jgi:predicted porin
MTNNNKLKRIGVGALLGWAAFAAQAQTEYSAYGVLDLSYGRFEPSGTVRENRLNSNSLTASFVGVNLKHGLENGWTPGITLETFLRFQDARTGRRDSDPLLSRNAFVSLGSKYGTLRAGRLQTFLFDTTARFNALGNSPAFSPAMRHVLLSGNLESVQGDFYWNNALSYQSPPNLEGLLEGVSVNLMYGQGPSDDRGDLAGGSIVVARGLLALTVGAQHVHVDNGIDDPTSETTWQLGATYNFGLARVFGLYTQMNDRGLDVTSKVASAGFTVPVGPGTVEAQVARTIAKGPAVDRRHTTFSAAYLYAYDSVTDLYAVAMDDRVRGQTRGVSAAVGVRWRF